MEDEMKLNNIFGIKFRYTYVDNPEGNYSETIFVDDSEYPISKETACKLVKFYIENNDKSMILKSIADIYIYQNKFITR